MYHTIHLSTVYPVFQSVDISVPVFADRVFYSYLGIILAGIFRRISLDKVITESLIADIVSEEVEISVDILLYVGTRMVEVACAIPSLTGVACTRRLISLVGTLVVAADVRKSELICLSLIRLGREIYPRASHSYTIAMVDDNVGNKSHTQLLVGIYHRAQLCLSTESTVLFKPIDRMIAHVHRHRTGIS